MIFKDKPSKDPDEPDPNDTSEMCDREVEEYYDRNWRQYDQE